MEKTSGVDQICEKGDKIGPMKEGLCLIIGFDKDNVAIHMELQDKDGGVTYLRRANNMNMVESGESVKIEVGSLRVVGESLGSRLN